MATETKKKRKRYDKNSPEAQELIDEIVHGTFMKEGTMVAFPTCFPGVTVPIRADESHVTALDVTDAGMVYGGTSGQQAHLFVGMFHGATGCVFDLGTVEGADRTVAVSCGKEHVIGCVNGSKGGRVVLCRQQGLPFDLLQEWGFSRPAIHDLGQPVKGEPIVHAIASKSKGRVFGATKRHLFVVGVKESDEPDQPKTTVDVVGEVRGAGRLGLGMKGNVYGLDEGNGLWRFDSKAGTIKRGAVKLPKSFEGAEGLTWARDPNRGRLYTADPQGQLFTFDGKDEMSDPLGKARLAPITTMAATFDGRVFGFCGEGISRMFCYDPGREELSDIGVAISVFERRRYGYVFADAVTGRDGQIVFGEDDDLGHLWLYFPKILQAEA